MQSPTTRNDESNPLQNPEFYEAVTSQLREIFLEPELERREMLGAEVGQFAAIISPGGITKVLINDEVSWVAQAAATRPLKAGESLTSVDIDTSSIHHIRPDVAGPDDGWAGVADLRTTKILTFNFQRNRGKARGLLDLATEYRSAGLAALQVGHIRPATENLFAAAELAVKAGMLLIDDNPTKRHHEREAQFVEWARMGNSPESHAEALKMLRAARPGARCGDVGPELATEALQWCTNEVQAMIDLARERASHPLD